MVIRRWWSRERFWRHRSAAASAVASRSLGDENITRYLARSQSRDPPGLELGSSAFVAVQRNVWFIVNRNSWLLLIFFWQTDSNFYKVAYGNAFEVENRSPFGEVIAKDKVQVFDSRFSLRHECGRIDEANYTCRFWSARKIFAKRFVTWTIENSRGCTSDKVTEGNQKDLTRGRTDPTTLATFSSCNIELSPMTLTFENDVDVRPIKTNQHKRYLGQCHSKVIVRTHRHIPDRLLDLDH